MKENQECTSGDYSFTAHSHLSLSSFASLIPSLATIWQLKGCQLTKNNTIGLTQVGRRTGAMSGEVFYGPTVRRLEGSRTAKGIVGRRTADSWKFLLFFSNTLKVKLYLRLIGENSKEFAHAFKTATINIFSSRLHFQKHKKRWPILFSQIWTQMKQLNYKLKT